MLAGIGSRLRKSEHGEFSDGLSLRAERSDAAGLLRYFPADRPVSFASLLNESSPMKNKWNESDRKPGACKLWCRAFRGSPALAILFCDLFLFSFPIFVCLCISLSGASEQTAVFCCSHALEAKEGLEKTSKSSENTFINSFCGKFRKHGAKELGKWQARRESRAFLHIRNVDLWAFGKENSIPQNKIYGETSETLIFCISEQVSAAHCENKKKGGNVLQV